ncbi:vacuolar cation/proton exchanger 3 isoform X2 [Physcomitrium patens]|uniref:vacuolar cation/proton exchanger 3 isoform X2 n=1 Tax=Physcomitrium patens TaxID=3218 RepID=UPI000D16E7E7|nr:vacuolar cation/proton exchanger 3-like isoform X2 [Physcomitrium patens]|eukprot:XP_024386039.1 vacuolar cation/proton exchanger 3-like isoform X2 [Physcomitrella patens]
MGSVAENYQAVPKIEVPHSDHKDLELRGLVEENAPPSDSRLHGNDSVKSDLAHTPGAICCNTRCRPRSRITKLPTYVSRSMYHVLFGTKLCWLLLCVPVAVIGVSFGVLGHGWIFLLSLLGMAPLAERLGFVTEQLSFSTGSTVGGLLNATFGNATEMIICIMALRKNMIRVVQLSLLGSILSNMLLVLGCAFFFGGLKHTHQDQKFNKVVPDKFSLRSVCQNTLGFSFISSLETKPCGLLLLQVTAQVSSSLLLMAVMGLLFPAVLHATGTELQMGKSELALSRFSSIIMLVAYIAYLYFQLKTHRELYDSEEDSDEYDGASDDDEVLLGFWTSIGWLTILTIFISLLSEYLVDAIEGASNLWNVPIAFISVIILPIVGNAAEHASAVMFALKDKMDISLGVAIGSSTQISMFVIPFCVVIGWSMGTHMDLNFELFETATLFITVLVVAFMLQEGTSNYFKGLMLILCYLIVGASFFVHVDIPDAHPGA